MDFYSLVYVKSTLVGRLSEALCSLSDCLYKRPVVLGKQKRKWRSWRKMSAINAVQFPCISTKEDLHFWPVRNTWKCHSPLQITDLMLRLPLKSQFLFKMNVAQIVLCKKYKIKPVFVFKCYKSIPTCRIFCNFTAFLNYVLCGVVFLFV